MISKKTLPIHILVFLFPVLIATVRDGGGVLYFLLLIFGLLFGWSAWRSLDAWEKRALIGFSIFFILVSISLVNTQDWTEGIKRLERYIHFPLLIPMYLLLKKYQIETGKIFFVGLLLSAVVMFGQAFYQTEVMGNYRAIGAYHALILGDISMLVAVILICALLTLSQSLGYYLYLVGGGGVGLALSASIMSGTKGAWLSIPVVMMFFLWILRKKVGAAALILLAIVGVFLNIGVLNLKPVNYRVNAAVDQYHNYIKNPMKVNPIGERFELWRDSIRIWKAHPFIGTGIGDFNNDRLKFINNGLSYQGKQFVHAHNIYLDTLATAGLVGLLAMVLLIQVLPYKMFNSFWKKESDPWLKFYALSGMVTIISFAVFGLTEGWLARDAFVRTYLMCVLVFMSSIAVRKEMLERN